MDNCICLDLDEFAVMISTDMLRARKTHTCGECRATVLPGQRYERAVMKFDGELCVELTCQTCVAIRRDLFPCGWIYGEMWNSIHEEICMAEDDGVCICPSNLRTLKH